MITAKTMRHARRWVSQFHAAAHSIVREKVTHKPGYDDGVMALILSRIDDLQEMLIDLAARLPRRKFRRPLTAWQKHVATILGRGGSIRDAAASWNKRKNDSLDIEHSK